MSALEELMKKSTKEMSALEYAIFTLWEAHDEDEVAENAAEQVAALEDVKSKASIVIAGWELMSKTSDYDLNELKESLRKFAALC